MDDNELFPNIAEDWRVYWCNVCFYAVTFTDDDAETYGDEWYAVLNEAARHDH